MISKGGNPRTQDCHEINTISPIIQLQNLNKTFTSAGNENREDIKALIAALQSDKVKQFIEETYKGAVVPSF